MISVLFFPCFYHLSPRSLNIDNIKFKDGYLQEVAKVERDIQQELKTRKNKAETLNRNGFGFFTDNPGQLLIKRTILYLYARQDQYAWATLERDVRRYYRSDLGLKKIGNENMAILSRKPY